MATSIPAFIFIETGNDPADDFLRLGPQLTKRRPLAEVIRPTKRFKISPEKNFLLPTEKYTATATATATATTYNMSSDCLHDTCEPLDGVALYTEPSMMYSRRPPLPCIRIVLFPDKDDNNSIGDVVSIMSEG